jgi:hypothetical protein
MNEYSHVIILDLNITSYEGSDLHEVVPHFMTERDTKLALGWRASAEGPESFRLIIEIAAGITAGGLLKTFVQELSKDLYQWSKNKLQPLFEAKPQSTGVVVFEFEDVTVTYRSSGDEDLAPFFQELPDLLASASLKDADAWSVTFSSSEKEWQIEPVEDS